MPRHLLILAALGAAACSSPTTGVSSSPKSARLALPKGATTAAVKPLQGSLHPFALPERDAGRMDPTVAIQNMSLLFERTPARAKQLQKDLVDIQSPTSGRYHAWLSPTEFGDRYGASKADVARATAWLKSQGFHVVGASSSRSSLSFDGTVGQVEHAFQTEMHRYDVRGERHFALSRAPSVPAELGTVVAALHGAHDFRPHRRRPIQHINSPEGYAFGPSDFATIYDVNPLYANGITGTGQSIAIVGESFYNPQDVTAFRAAFSLDADPTHPNLPINVLVPNTGISAVLDQGDVSESELDLEWSGGVAKDAQVYFVYTGDSPTGYGFFDAMTYAVEQRTAPIVSVSYGTCEKGLTPSDAVYYEQIGDLAAMLGVTVLVASGDTGAAGCDGEQESAGTEGLFVSFPAAIPSLLAIGGTEFAYGAKAPTTYWNTSYAALSYIPEIGWNDTFVPHAQGLGASGGGYSVVFPRPYWQASALPTASFRGVPDLALSASAYTVPYVIYESWTAADGSGGTIAAEGPQEIGGTSASTPSFAGILALVNQTIAAPVPGLGNAGPALYALNTSAPSAFHDIVSGSNIVPCEAGTEDCPAGTSEYGYNAGVGYDLVTGLGSVDAYNLATAWATLAPTSTTLAVVGGGGTEPSTLQLTATIGSNATAKSLTGTVTFYFNTFDTSNDPDLGYVLAEAPVVADVADAGTQGATVTVTAPAPVGLTGASRIVAFYGGDSSYLASYSSAASVTATSTLTVAPTSITLRPNEQTTFTAMGGAPPVTWTILSDDTCNNTGTKCAESKSLTTTTAGFQAGPGAGSVTFQALDSDYAEARVTITVAGAPVDGGELIPVDAGVDAPRDSAGPIIVDDAGGSDVSAPEVDAGADVAVGPSGDDAGTGDEDDASATGARDASKADGGDASGSSGGCSIAASSDAPDLGMLAVLALGFAPIVSRRRRTR